MGDFLFEGVALAKEPYISAISQKSPAKEP